MAILKEKNVNKEAVKSIKKSEFLKAHSQFDNAEEIYDEICPPKKDKKDE
jgi:hypothetical protein